MSYDVFWRQPASTELLAHLLRAADKPGTMAAAREIERRLQQDPLHEGEGRGEHRRMPFVRPFCVLYSVDEPNRVVTVEQLRWVGR